MIVTSPTLEALKRQRQDFVTKLATMAKDDHRRFNSADTLRQYDNQIERVEADLRAAAGVR